MSLETDKRKEKKDYTPPKVLASYNKEELEKSLKPYGQIGGTGGGCGCGCGGL